MRHGLSPVDACLAALRRIVETTTERRLIRRDGRPNFDVKFYALAKDGRCGAAAIWSGAKCAVCSDGENRLQEAGYLYKRPEQEK